jgi:hypothetical protein
MVYKLPNAKRRASSMCLPRHRESCHQTGISPESVRYTCALLEFRALSTGAELRTVKKVKALDKMLGPTTEDEKPSN